MEFASPTPLFLANKRFDTTDPAWAGYVEWAAIPDLAEIVGIDVLLCERISFSEDRGWMIPELETVLAKVSGKSRINVLGVYRNPSRHIETPPAPGFIFEGYDLVEDSTGVSALSNCGGFPEVFSNDELNRKGLLSGFDRAADVRRRLKIEFPEEPHADCELYAVWRLE